MHCKVVLKIDYILDAYLMQQYIKIGAQSVSCLSNLHSKDQLTLISVKTL